MRSQGKPGHMRSGLQYMTDGGLETGLMARTGSRLPFFAAFTLLDAPAGEDALIEYYGTHLRCARRLGLGFVLDTPTWRGSPDWGRLLGLTSDELARANRQAAAFVADIAGYFANPRLPVMVNGVVGPRGGGESADIPMSVAAAQSYHRAQVASLAAAGVDLVTATTMPTVEEAIGVVRAAVEIGVPVAVSFSLSDRGGLSSGQSLRAAVEELDRETDAAAVHLQVSANKAAQAMACLQRGWPERVTGLKLLDDDRTTGEEQMAICRRLLSALPGLQLLGGPRLAEQRAAGGLGIAA